MQEHPEINPNQKLTKTYIAIHNFTFKYVTFFVTIIISFFILQFIIAKNTNASSENIDLRDILALQEKESIGRFNKLLKQSSVNDNMSIQIIQGPIQSDWDYIESINNLITYKWYIVPRFFYIYKTFPLVDISYFSTWEYEIKALDNFLQNIILAKKDLGPNNEQKKNKILPLTNNNIIDTFDLSCVFRNKIFQKICNNNIQRFIDVFFVYNISMDYDGLTQLFNKLAWDEQKKQIMCKNLEKYITYANDTNTKIRTLFTKCTSSSIEIFQNFEGFIQIQKELENKQITNTTYTNKNLNTYKLVSVLQVIYKEIINNRMNTTNIMQYFDFLKQVLKPNKIDGFYKDLNFYFIVYYIKPRLEDPNNRVNHKKEIDTLTKEINTINNGSDLLGFKWLLSQINNRNLIPIAYSDIYTGSESANNEIQKVRNIKLLENISYLKIKNIIYSWNNILVNGDILLQKAQTSNKEKMKLDTTFSMYYQNSTFIVEKVKVTNQNTLNAVLKELLSKTKLTLNQIYEYIDNNIIFYDKAYQTDTTNLQCEVIQNTFNTQDIVVNCTPGKVIFSKNITQGSESTTITYTIWFAEYQITNITISDIQLENTIKEKLKSIQTNQANFMDILKWILSYTLPQAQFTTTEWTNNMLIASEKIKNYLGINIVDIAEKNGRILVDFSVWGINFIGNYAISTHTIYPVYFKDILINNLPTKIKNLSLSLDDESQTDIYKFISNPGNYIKSISPESYLIYNKFISERK